jgi:RNA polymerase sigma-70 factor (sigma-E family)
VSDRDQFVAYVESSNRGLLRSAWLLTGDWPTAEDLVQAALIATWRRWENLGPVQHPDTYVRRVLVTTFLRWNKRRWRGEIATDRLPDRATDSDVFAEIETQAAVRTALGVLPPRQRAVVVLRYFADLTEAQTAEAMNCAVGTVKSQSAKALATVHDAPGLSHVLTEGGAP